MDPQPQFADYCSNPLCILLVVINLSCSLYIHIKSSGPSFSFQEKQTKNTWSFLEACKVASGGKAESQRFVHVGACGWIGEYLFLILPTCPWTTWCSEANNMIFLKLLLSLEEWFSIPSTHQNHCHSFKKKNRARKKQTITQRLGHFPKILIW